MPGTKRFLVVERDADLRFLYSRDLRQSFPGCAVIEAESCSGAIDSLTEAPVDAAIVNQAATDARGLEILRRIHAQHPHLTLVSIGESGMKTEALEAGASAFVEAGNPQQLGPTVRQAIDRDGKPP